MIAFRRGMDPHSLEISRGGKDIGYLQWHLSSAPRVVFSAAFEYLTISEMHQALEKWKEAAYM